MLNFLIPKNVYSVRILLKRHFSQFKEVEKEDTEVDKAKTIDLTCTPSRFLHAPPNFKNISKLSCLQR